MSLLIAPQWSNQIEASRPLAAISSRSSSPRDYSGSWVEDKVSFFCVIPISSNPNMFFVSEPLTEMTELC